MPKLPGVNHQDAVRVLEKAGFRVVRQGRHVVMTDGNRIVTIPRHNPVNAYTMGGIVRDAGSASSSFATCCRRTTRGPKRTAQACAVVMTLVERVSEAARRLAEAGIDARDAAFDAEVLARHALGWDRATYLARWREPATAGFEDRFEALVARRGRREPVARIVGRREFWGLDLEVAPAVLVPRPESELLVETALARLGDRTTRWELADVGTGSGCLAIALARELPRARVAATDVCPDALAVARRNAARHGAADRVTFHHTDLLDGLPGPFDLIVSNPPYVPDGVIGTLAPEVRRHEPAAALRGGPDGLDTVRRLVAAAADRLRPGGWLVMEVGARQSGDAAAVARRAGLHVVAVRPDLQGIPRAVVMQPEGEHGATAG